MPRTSAVPALTVDAKSHLKNIIHYAITCRQLSAAWLHPVENAVGQLAQWLAESDILHDIRQFREASLSPKQADPPVSAADELSASADASFSGNGTHQSRMNKLYKLIKDGKKGPKHLLLTVAPPPPKHVLLTVAGPISPTVVQDSDYEVIPESMGCLFKPGVFQLPLFEDDTGAPRGEGGHILTGLELPSNEDVQIIGGNFRLQGLTSVSEHQRLVEVLSIGTYTIISMILELIVLRDSGVRLVFPPEPSLDNPVEISQPSPSPSSRGRTKARASRAKEGLWSYIAKQSENIFGRVRTLSHDGFVTLPLPRQSGDSSSISSEPRLLPFTALLQDIKNVESVLSTTPGVHFPPPALLNELVEKETRTGRSDLTASQNTGLRSLLGWSVDHQLTGPNAFLRHQCITTLYSEYVKTQPEASTDESDTGQATDKLVPCQQRHWRTYQYYSRDKEGDAPLGEVVNKMIRHANETCQRPQCLQPLHRHQRRWVTGPARIVAKLYLNAEPIDEMQMWISCHECRKTGSKIPMSDGAWLLSFGKYLELLAYSPDIIRLTSPICEHTELTSVDEKDLLRCRSNIDHHFGFKDSVVVFTMSPVQDVYEIRIPRVQITKARALTGQEERDTIRDRWQSKERDKLRLEITMWWKDVKQHIGNLEDMLDSENADPTRKPLPPSPPSDTDDMPTPKPPKKDLPDDSTSAIQKIQTPSVSSISTSSTASSASSLALLTNLRQAFTATEQSLYSALNTTPVNRINDVRRMFLSTSKAAENRLAAWEKKHANGLVAKQGYKEPDWWSNGSYALPGGSIIVKEGEWASIIAFTLSASDYLQELYDMNKPRAASSAASEVGSLAPTDSTFTAGSHKTSGAESVVSNATSVETAVTSLTGLVAHVQSLATAKPTPAALDPDDESQAAQWHEPEGMSTHASRHDNPRDGSNILSLRDVLRNKAPVDTASLTSRFSGITNTASASSSKLGSKAPPSAFSAASLDMATQQVLGTMAPPTPDAADTIEKLLQDAGGDDYSPVDSTRPDEGEGTIKASPKANLPAQSANSAPISTQSSFAIPPAVPPKDFSTPGTSAVSTPTVEKTLSQITSQSSQYTGNTKGSSTPTGPSQSGMSTLAMGTLTSTIANAMRFVLSVGGKENEERPLPNLPHHGLLTMESPDIDSKPHIRYECVVGKRLKVSCTVYYAKQFDSLRRRCGIDEIFIQSLKQTENWAAEGGKSKANFWKTTDDRFIIKTLVDAWNVADLQVLTELGPSYFRYMDKTSKKPSVMAKMLGFYTVELKNPETGVVQSKTDLLIMENLFFERRVDQAFDLKGIEGRKVKPNSKGGQSQTLFDGEWLEGQKKALILLHPHSKTVLEEGIHEDCEFLAQSNIMDYSLLLGVDSEQKHIACGLVDTIGSYTFAKTLEYKAKQNIRKEVTVIPPNEYRDRFVKAINSYFVACPDKWSHPGPDYVFPDSLPSVL